MLQIIRDRAQGFLAWVIVLLISIPFALWGINEYIGGGGEVTVAKVNGNEISQQALQRELFRQRQQIQQALGGRLDPALFPEERLRSQVLEQMIQRELLIQAAQNSGLRIADAHLGSYIRSAPDFQQEGQFSPELYERILSREGMSPGMFEISVRQDLLTAQLQAGLILTTFSTGHEQDAYRRLLGQQRDVGFVVVPLQRFEEAVEVSEEAVERFHEENGDLFRLPERVSVDYLELSVDGIAAGINVGEQELRERYEAQIANYRKPEERHLRHILLAAEPDDSDSAVAARKQADELREQLLAGASFEELAKEYSDDPGSAESGGDLGFLSPGMLDAAFEKAAFSLEQGALSEPVRSAFGYHLIRVEAVRGGEVSPFDEVRGRILDEVKRERAGQQFYEQAEQLANLAYEFPDSLEEAAVRLGIEVQTSEPFGRQGGEGVFADPRVSAVAFSEEVLESGYNSEPIDISNDHQVVLRVRERFPAARRPLAEVREQIEARLRRDGAVDEAQQLADAMLARLRSGESPEAVAQAEGLEWKRVTAERTGDELPPALAGSVFAMPRPVAEGGPAFEQTALPGGDQAVLALYGVKEAAAEEEPVGIELARAAGEAEFDGFLRDLRARGKVVISKREEE